MVIVKSIRLAVPVPQLRRTQRLKHPYHDLRELIEEKVESFISQCAVIVNAAGEGSRLKPYTEEKPKPLIEIGKRKEPVMYWAMFPYLAAGVSKFVVGVRYRSDFVKERFRNGENLSNEIGRKVVIDYIEEPSPLGRAGCIKLGIEQGKIDAAKPAIVMNASDILRLNVPDLVRHYIWQRSTYGFEVIQVYAAGFRVQYGIGRLHPTTGQVVAFEEKPVRQEPTNTACYVVHERLADFRNIRNVPANPEDDIIYRWIQDGILGSFVLRQEDVISVKYERDLQQLVDFDFEQFLGSLIGRAVGTLTPKEQS